jgi:hypothetical protein
MQTLLATPALRQRLDEIRVDVDPLNAEQFTALAKVETDRYCARRPSSLAARDQAPISS